MIPMSRDLAEGHVNNRRVLNPRTLSPGIPVICAWLSELGISAGNETMKK